ncbi:hypothetical protein ABZT23_39485 [Streptomyces sp. NPDC005386]|uniref:hypothetical protein n=1 Tax=Streptomyces sp. NPDC005386 TaxID=3154562 RepID=UPI0033A7A923
MIVQGEDLGARTIAQRLGWEKLTPVQQWMLDSVLGLEPAAEGELQPVRKTQAREQRRQDALTRHAGWLAQQRDEQDELRAELWLAADVSRRLRAIAARGLSPEQVLAQLAEHARINDRGMMTVEPFLPG